MDCSCGSKKWPEMILAMKYLPEKSNSVTICFVLATSISALGEQVNLDLESSATRNTTIDGTSEM
jgi:hypothetical protein